MRWLLSFVFAVSVAACARAPATTSAEGCALTATHETSWSNPASPDTVTARADGPSCSQAILTVSIRNARGDALWAYARTYLEMTAGDGVAPEDAAAVSADEMAATLRGLANVTQQTTRALPEWRADAATLTESAETFAYETPFERDVYEMLRGRDLAMICLAAGAAASECLIIDPASGAPARMVAYSP